MGQMRSAILLALFFGLLGPAAAAAGNDVLDPKGRRIGEIRRDEATGTFDIRDEKGRNRGYGRENPINGSIDLFDKDSRRIGEIRRSREPKVRP